MNNLMNELPQVALVGRPNVGKSTLFNRFSRRYRAIIHEQAGATRDRKQAKIMLGSKECILVDTPGFEEGDIGSLQSSMAKQTIQAIQDAEVVCLIIDYLDGVTALDLIFIKIVRKYAKHILLIANKCEKTPQFDHSYYRLGFGEPWAISAAHGLGVEDLKLEIASMIPQVIAMQTSVESLRICIIGKPNAGKSTFINTILGKERLVTSAISGTTRDAIDIEWQHQGQQVIFTDTAGIRKKHKIADSLEQISTYSSIANIKLSQVVILMIDASVGIALQDLRLGNIALEAGKNLILAVNKWDLVKDKSAYKKLLAEHLQHSLSQVQGLETIYFSALDHKAALFIIEAAFCLYRAWQTRISTGQLNKWLSMAIDAHPLPRGANGRVIKLKYIIQLNSCPPRFKIFANTKDIPDNYQRYLINSLRQHFKLPSIPLRLYFAVSANPYHQKPQ